MRLPFALLLLAAPLWAAEDADAILRRLIAAARENNQRAQQYTYLEETRRFRFDKNGKPRQVQSETHEVIFVEGLKYKKLVQRNGKPLSARERARVEKDMSETAAERRKHSRPTAPGGVLIFSGRSTHETVDLGSLEELLTLFDNRVSGEEEVRGHKSWVIESTPRNGYVPANEHERQVLIFRKRLWVDKAESMLVRAVYTVAGEGNFFKPGSTIAFEYAKVDADTWEAVSLALEFCATSQPVFKPAIRTQYLMSKFQKFDVQSTVTTVEPEK